MKYKIHTYGCQGNERDSEIIAGIVEEMGYKATKNDNEADLILFNTCCVREKAEDKVFSQVGELKTLKEHNPDVLIAICGCMVQQKDMPSKIRLRLPHVNIVFGTHNIHELPALINEAKHKKSPQFSTLPDREDVVEGLPSIRQYDFKSLVNITYGCNNFCTYCIVPYVRGREKSRQPQFILSEIEDAVKKGTVEVTLLGQNVNSYGKDLNPAFSFSQLLYEVNQIQDLKWIRFLTSHPKDLSEDLIITMAKNNKICRHIHLPVQAGSNNTLKAMNRGYTRESYLKTIELIRYYLPGVSITTDIIVGFPGETEADFIETIKLIELVRFDSAFTFMYSSRSGTPAAARTDHIDPIIKKERLQRLMAVQNRISHEINQEYNNKIVKVLVEGASKNNSNILSGRTETNKTVLFPHEKNLRGKFVDVRITTPQTWILKGNCL